MTRFGGTVYDFATRPGSGAPTPGLPFTVFYDKGVTPAVLTNPNSTPPGTALGNTITSDAAGFYEVDTTTTVSALYTSNGAGGWVKILPSADLAYADRVSAQAAVLELQPSSMFGNSYMQAVDPRIVPNGTQWPFRVAKRLGMQTPSNFGNPGWRCAQIVATVLANWTANSRGVAWLNCILNDPRAYLDTAGATTTAAAFRSILVHLTSRATLGLNSTAFAFDPTWTNGTSTTAGGHFDYAWTGTTSYLELLFGPTGGIVTVKDTTGATVTTVDTSGYKETFTGVVKLTGAATGTNTVRVSITSGSVTVVGAEMPSATPPTIVWWQERPIPTETTANDLLTGTYHPACEAVAADFPTVLIVKTSDPWDASYFGSDGIHPNDKGHATIAAKVMAAILALAFRQGQNWITAVGDDAYVAPTVNYSTAATTAPTAPSAVAGTTGNQVNLTWTRTANDKGGTITAQPVQASSDGGSTWTTVLADAGSSASAAVVTTGLTQGTGYVFRVGATNSAGTTYSAASASVTAGAAPTVYFSDDFARADSTTSLGTTTVGGKTWTPFGANVFGISAQRAYRTSAATATPTQTVVTSGSSNGTVQMRLTSAANLGIVFRDDNTAGGGGYLFTCNAGAYVLYKRTGTGYGVLATVSGVTPAANDLLKVVLNGSSIKCYVNGVQVASVTDSTYTGLGFGFWCSTPNAYVDDIVHNSLIA